MYLKSIKILCVMILWAVPAFTMDDTLEVTKRREELEAKAKKLIEYYQESINSSDSVKYKKLYFEIFPDNFEDFNLIYGYVNHTPGPIYYQSHDHLGKFFNKFECIDETRYYTRLIDVSIGGSWDADAVNDFQDGVQARVIKNPKLTFDILKPMPDDKILSFFFFFFHGIHARWEEIPDELKSMEKHDKRVFTLMEKGLKNALEKSGH